MSKKRKNGRIDSVESFSNTSSNSQSPITVQVEIDYDKLAESIVRAENQKNEEQYKHSKRRIKILNNLNGIIYLAGVSYCIIKIYEMWSKSLYELYAMILFTTFFIILSIIFFVMQQESLDESKDETMQHFNSNTAFIALLIAVIEMMKAK